MTRIIRRRSAASRGDRWRVLPPLRDRIRTGVDVLFVGINPGVRSALTGHHFAGFSNRFWKLLYESRLVPEPITFIDDDRLPEWGFGITNIVARATPGIDTLTRHEYIGGRRRLLAKIKKYQPRVVALVGVTVFRAMFPRYKGRVVLGLQQETLGGSVVFVLPNTSGRNANFSYAEMLSAFRSLRRTARRLHGLLGGSEDPPLQKTAQRRGLADRRGGSSSAERVSARVVLACSTRRQASAGDAGRSRSRAQ